MNSLILVVLSCVAMATAAPSWGHGAVIAAPAVGGGAVVTGPSSAGAVVTGPGHLGWGGLGWGGLGWGGLGGWGHWGHGGAHVQGPVALPATIAGPSGSIHAAGVWGAHHGHHW